MNCPNCDSESAEVFMSEPIECAHCEKVTYVEYRRCSDCEIVFKAIGDKVVEDSLVDMPSHMLNALNDIVSTMFHGQASMMNEDEFRKVVEEMGEELDVKEIQIGKSDNMESLVHRCLNCNAVAYESSKGNYLCPDCGFVWEVVNCG